MPKGKSGNYRINTIQDEYLCRFCNEYKSGSRRGLILHIKYTHGLTKIKFGEDSYRCVNCDRLFGSDGELVAHMRRDHQV